MQHHEHEEGPIVDFFAKRVGNVRIRTSNRRANKMSSTLQNNRSVPRCTNCDLCAEQPNNICNSDLRKLQKQLYVTGCCLQTQTKNLETTIQNDFNSLTNQLNQIQSTLSCQTSTPIFPSDVLRGFVISEPGEYCLVEDCVHVPNQQFPEGFSAAILIQASNVTLDLNDKTLSQQSSNNFYSIGIIVDGDNISVRNGTVSSFNINGVFINSKRRNLSLEDLVIIRNGYDKDYPPALDAIVVTGGLIMAETSNAIVKNCVVNDNIGIGAGGGTIFNVLIDNCTFNNTITTSQTLGGFAGVAVGLLIIVQPDLPGYFDGISNNIFITNSTFNGSTGILNSYGLVINGAYPAAVPGGAQIYNVLLENCTANNISTIGGSDVFNARNTKGITLFVNGAVLRNCKAMSISSTNGLNRSLVGIQTSSNDILVEDCVTENIKGSCRRMCGFSLDNQGANIHYKNCTASNIINTNADLGTPPVYTFGFGLTALSPSEATPFPQQKFVNVIVEGCIASNVSMLGYTELPTYPVPPDETPKWSAGFIISLSINPILRGCTSSNNDIGVLAYDYYPEILELPPSNGIIQSNTVLGNRLAGFYDTTQNNNAYIDNYARGNNGLNYGGVPAGTPIVFWPIPGAPSEGITKLSNLDISP